MSKKAKAKSSKRGLKILAKLLAAVCVMAGFAGSVYYAVVSGGEIFTLDKQEEVKGMMQLLEVNYSKTYFEGDTFSFDGKNSQIRMVVKDPAKEELIKIDNLPEDKYCFQVNGEGRIYSKSIFIEMEKGMTHVDVISVDYPNVRASLPVEVYDNIDESKLSSEMLLEAENAEVYKDDVLLTQEQLESNPYLSSHREPPEGADCSGGVCLYNFQTNNMKVVFTVVCTQETQATLDIMICQRKVAGAFDSFYLFTVNGETVDAVSSQNIPARPTGASDYFNPYTMEQVTVTLHRGVNRLVFESGSKVGRSNPVNLDAIRLTTAQSVLGSVADMTIGK